MGEAEVFTEAAVAGGFMAVAADFMEAEAVFTAEAVLVEEEAALLSVDAWWFWPGWPGLWLGRQRLGPRLGRTRLGLGLGIWLWLAVLGMGISVWLLRLQPVLPLFLLFLPVRRLFGRLHRGLSAGSLGLQRRPELQQQAELQQQTKLQQRTEFQPTAAV